MCLYCCSILLRLLAYQLSVAFVMCLCCYIYRCLGHNKELNQLETWEFYMVLEVGFAGIPWQAKCPLSFVTT